MGCVLITKAHIAAYPELVYNFGANRDAVRAALAIWIGKQPTYIKKSFQNRHIFEIWAKEIHALDMPVVQQFYQDGYKEAINHFNKTGKYGMITPKAKELGLKYKDVAYQAFYAGFKDGYYDVRYNTPGQRKLI